MIVLKEWVLHFIIAVYRICSGNIMRSSHPVIKVVGISLLCITASTPVYGYIDPGTGSLIIQSVIGAIAAVGITLKLYWHKLKVYFFSRTNNTDDEEVQGEEHVE